jgi:hypothetical protein
MQHYTRGPCGEWAHLFRRGDGYLGTKLLQRCEDSREYLTLDRWNSRAAYADSEPALAASIGGWTIG